jgi:hypothetical protein
MWVWRYPLNTTTALQTGAVVRLRQRLWRIDRIDARDFWATPLDGRDTRRWRFLRSLEEENVRPGELPEPDAKIVSDPAKQDLLLRAYRLSLMVCYLYVAMRQMAPGADIGFDLAAEYDKAKRLFECNRHER